MELAKTNQRVIVLGASDKPERAAFTAVQRLLRAGYDVIPVNPALESVLGIKCVATLKEVAKPVDTITVYLGEKRSTPLIADILAIRPQRILLNPGTENNLLKQKAEENGIEVEEACTLVLLGTGQF